MRRTRSRISQRRAQRLRKAFNDLRVRLWGMTKMQQMTSLTTWADPGQRMRDEINTARRLGFVVEVEVVDTAVRFTAVKRQPGQVVLDEFDREHGGTP